MIISRQAWGIALAMTVLACSAEAAYVEQISNGGFESGGAGWKSRNVVFTGNFHGLTSYSGNAMAVIGGRNPLAGAKLFQKLDFGDETGYAEVSFAYRLAALDFNPLDEWRDKGDLFTVKLGGQTLVSAKLDDPNFGWSFSSFGPTITDWVQVTKLVPISSLADALSIQFRSINLDKYQALIALVDQVSIKTHSQPVPEPATLVIWSVLGGIGLVVACGRNRKEQMPA